MPRFSVSCRTAGIKKRKQQHDPDREQRQAEQVDRQLGRQDHAEEVEEDGASEHAVGDGVHGPMHAAWRLRDCDLPCTGAPQSRTSARPRCEGDAKNRLGPTQSADLADRPGPRPSTGQTVLPSGAARRGTSRRLRLASLLLPVANATRCKHCRRCRWLIALERIGELRRRAGAGRCGDRGCPGVLVLEALGQAHEAGRFGVHAPGVELLLSVEKARSAPARTGAPARTACRSGKRGGGERVPADDAVHVHAEVGLVEQLGEALDGSALGEVNRIGGDLVAARGCRCNGRCRYRRAAWRRDRRW